MSASQLRALPLLLLVACLQLCRSQENQMVEDYYSGPYLQVYPPTDITLDPANCTPSDGQRCPLFVAYMTSFGGAFTSAGAIPGVQIALDQINEREDLLPGYTLHYVLRNSNVSMLQYR